MHSDAYLLEHGMLDDVAALAALARGVVRPALDYYRTRILGRDRSQVERMRVSGFFEPRAINAPSQEGIDALGEKFRFLSRHAEFDGIVPKMKAELPIYHALISSITPLEQRKDALGNDTFDIADFWSKAASKLPAMALALRGVMAHSPNSAPPERVFSIMGNTFDDNQETALNDYVELSLQLQYNARGRSCGA